MALACDWRIFIVIPLVNFINVTWLPFGRCILDPLPFDYRSGRVVDGAKGTLLNMILTHLEGTKTFVRLVFIDFFSALNCIQPHFLAERRLCNHNINPGLICGLIDFLTAKSQHVRVDGILSNVLFSSTESPPRDMSSPLFFFLFYISWNVKATCSAHITKFADDSVIVSLLNSDDPDHGSVVSEFSHWYKSSSLSITVSKTKE